MKAPGPSPLQFLRGVRKRGMLAYVGDLWREHGDVFQVRLGARTLMFLIHPDMVEHVATAKTRANYDKGTSHESIRKYLTGQGLVASTGDLWRRQRRLIAPFFTPKGIRAYADAMIRDGVLLQARWDELAQRGTEVEISEEMSAVTASIIVRTMFGGELEGSVPEVKRAIETMIEFVSPRPFILPPFLGGAGTV